jgi:hypothetical protein
VRRLGPIAMNLCIRRAVRALNYERAVYQGLLIKAPRVVHAIDNSRKSGCVVKYWAMSFSGATALSQ